MNNMKNLMTLCFLLTLIASGLTSCHEEYLDGDWDPMEWTEPEGLTQIKDRMYQVPDTGGTYTMTCTNYTSWFINCAESGDTIYSAYGKRYVVHTAKGDSLGDLLPSETPNLLQLTGDWFEALHDQANLVVTFDPLPDTVATRTVILDILAGDTGADFYFVQGKKQ